jgi:hypothetical protein
MPCAEYYVSKDALRWKIRCGDTEFDYDTKLSAMAAAIQAAAQSGSRGFEACVFVQSDEGGWEQRWIYGRDEVPSAG